MLQQLLVILLFLVAAGYLVRLVVSQFRTKDGCSGGCSKCSVDFSKIEGKISDEKF